MPKVCRLWPPLIVLLFILKIAESLAAPLPPFAPVDVTGKIVASQWTQEQRSEGVPGMSGTAGQDRTFPAHFILKLTKYTGVTAEAARQMTQAIDWHAIKDGPEDTLPPFILLRINHIDAAFLKVGMIIQVDGYTVNGDEGGTWTSFKRLTILSN